MYDGREKPSIEMRIKNGELVMGKAERREGIVTDADIAIQRLLQGETVYVQQYAPIVRAVQRTVEMTLQKSK